MLSQPGNAVGCDEEARGVEAVEAGEDQHQPHQRQVRVVPVGSSRASPSFVYLPMRGPRLSSTPSVKTPATPCTTRRRDRVVEAEPDRQPAAGAPAPGGVHDPDDRAEDRGEDEVSGEPHALDERAGHDRRRSSTRRGGTRGRRRALRWFWRFGPISSAHGAVCPQKPGNCVGPACPSVESGPIVGSPGSKQP